MPLGMNNACNPHANAKQTAISHLDSIMVSSHKSHSPVSKGQCSRVCSDESVLPEAVQYRKPRQPPACGISFSFQFSSFFLCHMQRKYFSILKNTEGLCRWGKIKKSEIKYGKSTEIRFPWTPERTTAAHLTGQRA